MSYNKLKSLVANVEAIKTALQIHIQGRQATPEEKETLSQYSGFGGIKEVLNIGTDKPVSGDMEEPIRRLQELIDTYPYFTEAMKASVLTAFYTPKFLIDVVAKQIHATFKDNELQMRSFLEPSAGIGGFLPVAMSDTCGYAIEKDPVSGLILSLLNDRQVHDRVDIAVEHPVKCRDFTPDFISGRIQGDRHVAFLKHVGKSFQKRCADMIQRGTGDKTDTPG